MRKREREREWVSEKEREGERSYMHLVINAAACNMTKF